MPSWHCQVSQGHEELWTPLPCALGCSGQGCSDAPCDMGWELGPGPRTQKSSPSWLASTAATTMGTARASRGLWGSWHYPWHCQQQRAGLWWPWSWTPAAHGDFPGSSREFFNLSFPEAELLERLGTSPGPLLPVGFPAASCWHQWKAKDGQLGLPPHPSCLCSRVARALWDMGQGRAREGLPGLGHSRGFAMVVWKGHGRHWASALPWGSLLSVVP